VMKRTLLALGPIRAELENGCLSGGSGLVVRSRSSAALIGSSFNISAQDPLRVVGEALCGTRHVGNWAGAAELRHLPWVRSKRCRRVAT
jgi:hypothetical protein